MGHDCVECGEDCDCGNEMYCDTCLLCIADKGSKYLDLDAPSDGYLHDTEDKE